MRGSTGSAGLAPGTVVAGCAATTASRADWWVAPRGRRCVRWSARRRGREQRRTPATVPSRRSPAAPVPAATVRRTGGSGAVVPLRRWRADGGGLSSRPPGRGCRRRPHGARAAGAPDAPDASRPPSGMAQAGVRPTTGPRRARATPQLCRYSPRRPQGAPTGQRSRSRKLPARRSLQPARYRHGCGPAAPKRHPPAPDEPSYPSPVPPTNGLHRMAPTSDRRTLPPPHTGLHSSRNA